MNSWGDMSCICPNMVNCISGVKISGEFDKLSEPCMHQEGTFLARVMNNIIFDVEITENKDRFMKMILQEV